MNEKIDLELLLGRYPDAAVELSRELSAVPPPVPAGLLAELVARRPDPAAAERRLGASAARLARRPCSRSGSL